MCLGQDINEWNLRVTGVQQLIFLSKDTVRCHQLRGVHEIRNEMKFIIIIILFAIKSMIYKTHGQKQYYYAPATKWEHKAKLLSVHVSVGLFVPCP